jgi:hypothetical protein
LASPQDLKREPVKKLQFKFKYFPENVADEVIQDNTLRMLFRQVRPQTRTGGGVNVMILEIFSSERREKYVLLKTYQ